MSDLLIRDINPELKRRLAEQARRDGRSLSEEAKVLLGRAMAGKEPVRGLGTALVELFRSTPVELELARDEMPRPPPDFE